MSDFEEINRETYDERTHTLVIHIPQTILEIAKLKNPKGLTIFLNQFNISQDRLFFREEPEEKLSLFAHISNARIGDKDFDSKYVNCELISPQDQIPQLLNLQTPEKNKKTKHLI